jgi:hypothetical protein
VSASWHLRWFFRRSIEVIQAGLLGQVRLVHMWCDGYGRFPPSHDRPAGEDPVPLGLNWDFWLGPVPFRPRWKMAGPSIKIPLEYPLSDYFTATTRGGSAPSTTLDLFGVRFQPPPGDPAMCYARVKLW